MKTLSIVVPVYNERPNLPTLHEALTRAIAPLPYSFEFVFVDDGSTDGSLPALEDLARRDPRARVVPLVRNFGKEAALTAGIRECRGDACLTLDADLQHPVEMIPEFVRRWEAGAEVVVGIRERNEGEGCLGSACSAAFYRLMNLVADTPLRARATDFRLLDREVIDAFAELTERSRMTRALIDWLGYRTDYVPFVARPRAGGRPSYRFFPRARLAFSTVVSHSLFPLRVAGYLGILITLLSGALGGFILVERFILKDPLELNFSGPAMLAVFNLFLIGIVLVCLGLIALYIANIQAEVVDRPLYKIRKRPGRDAS